MFLNHKRKNLSARKEINEVLGERTEITYQDVNKLKYCSNIFKEALRMYSPVVIISRLIPEDMAINGIEVPKGTTINVIINKIQYFALHHLILIFFSSLALI